MRQRYLLLVLLVLFLAGCSLDPASLQGIHTPTMSPTATVGASSTPNPTLTPTTTRTSTPTTTPTPSPTPTPRPEARYKRLILINQDTQTMYVYQNGVKIRTIPVSTGKPTPKTMTPAWEGQVGKYVGTFFSYGTYVDNAWYLFEHDGGILIHGAPYLLENGKKVYQELDALGMRPLSHGCIRLPPEEAAWLTAWGPQGAHVIITPLTRSE